MDSSGLALLHGSAMPRLGAGKGTNPLQGRLQRPSGHQPRCLCRARTKPCLVTQNFKALLSSFSTANLILVSLPLLSSADTSVLAKLLHLGGTCSAALPSREQRVLGDFRGF